MSGRNSSRLRANLRNWRNNTDRSMEGDDRGRENEGERRRCERNVVSIVQVADRSAQSTYCRAALPIPGIVTRSLLNVIARSRTGRECHEPSFFAFRPTRYRATPRRAATRRATLRVPKIDFRPSTAIRFRTIRETIAPQVYIARMTPVRDDGGFSYLTIINNDVV